jgi:hypothetical protein
MGEHEGIRLHRSVKHKKRKSCETVINIGAIPSPPDYDTHVQLVGLEKVNASA